MTEEATPAEVKEEAAPAAPKRQRPVVERKPQGVGVSRKDTGIQALKALLGDEVTEAQIDAVLAAQQALAEGDPVGTVRKDDETGKVAHRVNVNGIVQWRVTCPQGDAYSDLQPTLPWPVIHAVV